MSISKKTRFEVFKRDKFTCQYCGKSAPNVVLHIDHILPVSKDGSDDITNLVTSCKDCNLGKSNRLLSDDAAIEKKKKQLDELQERREQLEMMMEWQRSLIDIEGQAVEELASFWRDLVPGYNLNDHGLQNLAKWTKKYGLQEICEGIRVATDTYLKYDSDNKITHDSVEEAWGKVPGICYNKRIAAEKPYMRDLYYARGILRKRLSYYNKWQSIELMEQACLNGADVEDIKNLAKSAKNWTQFRETLEYWIAN